MEGLNSTTYCAGPPEAPGETQDHVFAYEIVHPDEDSTGDSGFAEEGHVESYDPDLDQDLGALPEVNAVRPRASAQTAHRKALLTAQIFGITDPKVLNSLWTMGAGVSKSVRVHPSTALRDEAYLKGAARRRAVYSKRSEASLAGARLVARAVAEVATAPAAAAGLAASSAARAG